MFKTQFDYDIKFAKTVLENMNSDAIMVANSSFDCGFMLNYIITDGENTIAMDTFEDYFLVNDGDRELRRGLPCTRGAMKRIYNLGIKFLKNHTYTVGFNPMF